MAKIKNSKNNEFNIIITGVGGQGVMTLGALIANAAMNSGKTVKTSELHGLAKRFGHTEFHLRIGNSVKTTIVPNKSADLVIALEPLETQQIVKYCDKERTNIFSDSIQIKPTRMDVENIPYPTLEEMKKRLKEHVKEMFFYSATEESVKQTGLNTYANIYLLGKIVKHKILPLTEEEIKKTIIESIGKDEQNLKIFDIALKGKE